MGVLGIEEIVGLAIVGIVLVVPAWRICARAGYPGALGLLAAVPPLGLLLAYFLAFAPWRKAS